MSDPIEGAGAALPSESRASSRVKLPKLQLRSFNSDLTKWTSFWESFNSAVHRESVLVKVDPSLARLNRGFHLLLKRHTPVVTVTSPTLPMNVTPSHKLMLGSSYFGKVEDATRACGGATGTESKCSCLSTGVELYFYVC